MNQSKLFPTRALPAKGNDLMKQIKAAGRRDLRHAFMLLWDSQPSDRPEPHTEYRFHPERKWRFDLAWPVQRVAVELDGGIFTGGGHNRGRQFAGNAEKHNAAVMLGWKLLRYTTVDIRERPVQMIEQVLALLAVTATETKRTGP